MCSVIVLPLHAQENNNKIQTTLDKNKEVDLTFNTLSKERLTGSVVVINVQEELKSDQRSGLEDLIYGKVSGVLGATNTWGTGNAVVFVDGVRHQANYLNSLNMMEVETVIILKDAASKALYGVHGDTGVILINTMRGREGEHSLRVQAQTGISTPKAMPKYLNAADYMKKYNEAQLNDGVDPTALRYSQDDINGTLNGTNPARFPDNDYYSTDYLKKTQNYVNVFADAMGGSNSARYYVSSEWNHNNGWLNTPQGDVTDELNIRGNLDFEVNEFITMSVDAVGRFSFNTQPNAGDYWDRFATELPNSYPAKWDPAIITDETYRNSLTKNAKLYNGQLIGGNSSYLKTIHGDLIANGNTKTESRNLQFSTKLDLDLSFITKGLSARVFGMMNNYNVIYTAQNPNYMVYQPHFTSDGALDDVLIYGENKASRRYEAVSDESDYNRQYSIYATLGYNRHIGSHNIAATAMIYNDAISFNGIIQDDASFHSGIAANYMYQNKYITELSLMGVGTRKLDKDNNFEFAPSFGLGWVMSNEDFMSSIALVNYLKIRGSFGIIKNDSWDSYFTYKNTFVRGSNYNYNNGNMQNAQLIYNSVANDIRMQKRREFTIGADAVLANNKLTIEFGYFNSASIGNITKMSNTYPEIMGYDNLIFSNYNSDLTQGVEFGASYRFDINNDLQILAGANLLYRNPKYTKREEPKYEGSQVALLKEGTASDAMWGYKANGLYSEDDFKVDGTLKDDLPTPTFGTVYPGDIKYLDQNGDGIIDSNDQRIIGHGTRTQYSLYTDIRFKQFGLYILGIGREGNSKYRNEDYYWIYGDLKFSEVAANGAYSANNKDINAAYPRLSISESKNNYRNSDFWIYKDNPFTIPTLQLTYHFDGGNVVSFIKDSRIYLRASDVLVIDKNKEYNQLNLRKEPKTSSVVVGFVTSF